MVGSEIMVAPVLDEGADKVKVYLPAGIWIHLWTGETFGSEINGKYITIEAPLGQPAVFYKAGSQVGLQLENNLRSIGLLR